MERRIFVGSSTESIEKAKQICHVLSNVEQTEGVLWTDVFDPGSLTFEALEQMLVKCCGAVFVATPDDESVIRGKTIKSPRANVLLEFGLVAGRLGRNSIALCRYGEAELPSDLKGLTIIEMDKGEEQPDSVSKQAEERLRIWGSRLIPTVEAVPRTALLHGYTGRWSFQLALEKWRDLSIDRPDYVQINGSVDLLLSPNGQDGKGMAHGRLFFKLFSGAGLGPNTCQGEYRTAHEITSASLRPDGSLQMSTQAFAQQKMSSSGNPPAQILGMDVLPEPWSSQWMLNPGSEPRTLEGQMHSDGVGLSKGTIKMTKLGDVQ